MTDFAPAAAPRKTRRYVLAVGLAVIVVLAGSAAFAFQKLSGGGTQPEDVLPASVVAYARLDGDPSASQKVKLLHLLNKSPDLAKQLGIKDDKQDLRKTLFSSLLSDCEIDYNAEIKPWIGDRFGVGVAKSGDTGFFAIQVTDEKAARKGIALAAGCLGLKDPGVVFAKGYALLGEGQKATAAAAKQAETSPLADKPAFIEDMKSLGDPGIASVWADATGLGDTFGSEMGDAGKSLNTVRSGALTLRAGGDNIELTGIAHTAKDIGKVSTVDLGALPESSLLAASASGGGKQVDRQWTTFTEGFVRDQIDSTLAEIEQQTGFVLPADLKTLLGDNITLVVGDRNLETIDSIQGPEGLSELDIAVALHSDKTAGTALANKIAKEVEDFAGLKLAVVSTSDGAVFATNEEFANDFTKGKSLSDGDSFASVIGDDNSAYGGFFFDIAKAVKVASGMDLPASAKDDLDQLKDLKALGFSANKDGDRVIRGTLKLSFN